MHSCLQHVNIQYAMIYIDVCIIHSLGQASQYILIQIHENSESVHSG